MKSRVIAVFFCSFLHVGLTAQDQLSVQDSITADIIADEGIVQDTTPYNIEITSESSVYDPPVFHPDYKDKYRERAFQYTTEENQTARKIKMWLLRLLDRIFGSSSEKEVSPWYDIIFNTIVITVLIVAVASIVRLLLGKDSLSLFFRRKTSSVRLLPESEIDMSEAALTHLIQSSIENGDYRSALRYHYLLLLKKMDRNGVIQYHPEKTDSDYVQEIKDIDSRKMLSYLIYLYHRTWYGQYEISRNEYSLASESFDQMYKLLRDG
jgi:hypothetical protein